MYSTVRWDGGVYSMARPQNEKLNIIFLVTIAVFGHIFGYSPFSLEKPKGGFVDPMKLLRSVASAAQ